jgi:hypothetical protein
MYTLRAFVANQALVPVVPVVLVVLVVLVS